jgi:hypothetical protein
MVSYSTGLKNHLFLRVVTDHQIIHELSLTALLAGGEVVCAQIMDGKLQYRS